MAVLLALSAAAHAGPREDPAMENLDTVEVIGHRQSQANEVRKASLPQRIIVAEEEVRRYGDATVGDVLRRLPGMTFTGPAGVTKDIRMRGLDKGYTQILIDGAPVAGATQERQIQVDRLPADMIERIEIIRNPSAEYDASGIGGTINIIMKRNMRDATTLRVAYGRNGDLDVGDAIVQWGKRFGRFNAAMGLSYTVGAEDVDESKTGFNATRTVTQREVKSRPVEKTELLFTPRLSWDLREDDRLTLDPFFSFGTEDKDEQAVVRNLSGAVTRRTEAREEKNDRVARIAGRYDGAAAWGGWFVNAGVQQGQTDKNKFTTERNAAAVVGKRSRERETIREDQAYAGAGVVWMRGDHTIKAGVELRDAEYDKRKSVAEAGNATAPLVPRAPGANDIYRIEERRLVGYVQDDWQVAEHHWLTPGLRYERIERDATDRNGVGRSSTDDAVNPSLHYRWSVTTDINLRTSVARTVRMPKFDDLNPLVTLATGAGAGSITRPDKGGNAALGEEQAVGIEAGIEWFFRDNAGHVGLNLYNRDIEDFVQKESRLEGARYVERPYNVGDARFWGAELDLRVPLLDRDGNELLLTGGHSELRGEVSAPGMSGRRDVKDLPPRVSNLGLAWKHQGWGLSGGFSANHSPSFTSDSVNTDGIRELKSRNASTLLDVYFGKRFGRTFELRLIAKNILRVDKRETTVKYNANGSFNAGESKMERSQPTIYLLFESRF